MFSHRSQAMITYCCALELLCLRVIYQKAVSGAADHHIWQIQKAKLSNGWWKMMLDTLNISLIATSNTANMREEPLITSG